MDYGVLVLVLQPSQNGLQISSRVLPYCQVNDVGLWCPKLVIVSGVNLANVWLNNVML